MEGIEFATTRPGSSSIAVIGPGSIESIVDNLASWTELDRVLVAIRDKVQRIHDETAADATGDEHRERVVELLARAGRVAKHISGWGSTKNPRVGIAPPTAYALPESRLHDHLEQQARTVFNGRDRRGPRE